MSIVTKTGDKGETALFDGQRVPKSHERISAIGEVDELCAHIGLLRSQGADKFVKDLYEIQCELFELGALIAMPNSKKTIRAAKTMTVALSRLEKNLYALEATLPPLKNFILPGGHPLAAQFQIARAVSRRAERAVSKLSPLPKDLLPYLNRLSDYLFLAARHVNRATKNKEVLWSGDLVDRTKKKRIIHS